MFNIISILFFFKKTILPHIMQINTLQPFIYVYQIYFFYYINDEIFLHFSISD